MTEERKEKNKTKILQGGVRLYYWGCERLSTHRCNPTTVRRENFRLLCFHPGPIHSSLTKLESSYFSILPILTPNLARTPDLHRITTPRNPGLKPSKHPSLQLAILGDPGAVSLVDKMSVVKVYCKIETSPWTRILTEPVPEALELPYFDWPEFFFSGQLKYISEEEQPGDPDVFLHCVIFLNDRHSCEARSTGKVSRGKFQN